MQRAADACQAQRQAVSASSWVPSTQTIAAQHAEG